MSGVVGGLAVRGSRVNIARCCGIAYYYHRKTILKLDY